MRGAAILLISQDVVCLSLKYHIQEPYLDLYTILIIMGIYILIAYQYKHLESVHGYISLSLFSAGLQFYSFSILLEIGSSAGQFSPSSSWKNRLVGYTCEWYNAKKFCAHSAPQMKSTLLYY